MEKKSEAQILYQMYINHSLGSLAGITRGLTSALQMKGATTETNIQRISKIEDTYQIWFEASANNYFANLEDEQYEKLFRQQIVEIDILNQEFLSLIEFVKLSNHPDVASEIQKREEGIKQICSSVVYYRQKIEALNK